MWKSVFSPRTYLPAMLCGMAVFLICISRKVDAQGIAGAGKADSAAIKKTLLEAQTMMKRSELERGRSLFEQAYIQSRDIQYLNGVCNALIGLSYYEFYNGKYGKALDLLNEAEQTNSDVRNNGYASLIENRRGNIYDRMGIYEKAAHHYLKGLNLAEQTQGGYKGNAYANLASVFQQAGNYASALHYADLAEKEILKKGDSIALAGLFINKGTLYFVMNGEKDGSPQAIAYTQQALAIAKKMHLDEVMSNALANLAGYEMKAGKPDFQKALSYLNQALNVENAASFSNIMCLSNIADCYFHIKQFDKAEPILHQALELAKQTNSNQGLLEVYNTFANGFKLKGDFRKATEYMERYMQMKDSVQGEKVSNKINALQFEYETAQKDNELIKKELEISRQQGTIQRKNMQGYGLVSGGILLGIFSLVYYRNRQRIQKQQSQITAWRASMDGEENERNRLARELHDNIGGSLSTVKMWLGTIQKQHSELSEERDFNEAIHLLDNTLQEVRNTAHHLMPELLLRHGLAEAVRIFCLNIQKAAHIQIEYQYFGYIGELEKGMELMIYRTLQELVQNVAKHSGADAAVVQLSRHDDILSITVEDNGRGMPDADMPQPDGMGLAGIRRNIGNLKGQFSIRSEKGNGTTVYIEISVKESRDRLTGKRI